MGTLAAGTSKVFTLNAGQALNVSGSAEYYITPGMVQTISGGLIGPYQTDISVYFKAISQCEVYETYPGNGPEFIYDETGQRVSCIKNGNSVLAMPSYANKRSVVGRRFGGMTSQATGTYTMHLTMQAPAHYDAVQVTLRGISASGVNTFKVSVCNPAQKGNGYVPLDGAGATMSFVPITWGTTDEDNFRNPGGGAANTVLNNASGSLPNTQIENDVTSDWLAIRSSDRVDVTTRNPLIMIRVYGINPGASNWTQSSDISTDPLTQIDPDFYSGYWGSDTTATADPGSAATQQWMPVFDVRFLLRGKVAYSIGVAGDSVDQGWIAGTAVPRFGGNMNGWAQRLVKKLNQSGVTTSFVDMTQTGSKSFVFHSKAYSAIVNRELTHLFVKPWSVNESGDGVASVYAGITRTQQLIELCRKYNVTPIIVFPWGGQGLETPTFGTPIYEYMESLRSSGVYVFDAREIVNVSGVQPLGLRPEMKTLDAGGAVVDSTHLNEFAQEIIANFALECSAGFSIV